MAKKEVSSKKAEEFSPYHRTVIDLIVGCPKSASKGEIIRILEHVGKTKTPDGHDAILDAITEQWDPAKMNGASTALRKAKLSLRKQKSLALGEANKKKSQVKIAV